MSKKNQSWWDGSFTVPTFIVTSLVIICVLGLLGSFFFLVMDWNDMPTDISILFDIDEYKEHLKSLRNELDGIDCDVLAENLLSDVYPKTSGIIYSDYYFAEKEYGYKCLGEKRPQITEYEKFTSIRGKT